MNHKSIFPALLLPLLFIFIQGVFAQSDEKKKEILEESDDAKKAFLKADPDMAQFFENSYGYLIFPNVGKGGLVVGGAAGNGVVYEQGKMIGYVKLSQVSVGLQAGGQEYREVVFFESTKEMDRFKENKIELSAQASAVVAASGASANAKYVEGVAVFTMQKEGLMVEASVGGQKFKFEPE